MNRPDVIYILADDMGYGDMRPNNPDCRIPTPNLDRLAARGMRFTDAHAGSSVCTPSRYAILEGRYCWRSRLKNGIVWHWDGALLEPDRPTVANLFRDHGYRTGCIGKWHLGWDWPTVDGAHPNETLPFGQNGPEINPERQAFGERIDYSGRLGGGPVDRGFDTYFGVDVPNFPPYTWFEDDRLAEIPTEEKPEEMYGQPGKAIPGWDLERMIPELTRRAVDFVERHAGDEPYFLYFPLTSPHSPVVPNKPFQGRSGCGHYGDFVYEVDWVVGELLDALERAGTAEDTLVVFTSDNGPEGRVADDIGAYERVREYRHYSMGPLRGIKADAWEGGHRVPFLASWPRTVPRGTRCDQPVCLVDLMATVAEILTGSATRHPGEDSVSMLPLLRGETSTPTRRRIVHQSAGGKFALREGEWVYIDASSGGQKQEPDWWREERGYAVHEQPGELFNLKDDLAERVNRYADHPEVVERMKRELERIKENADAALSHQAIESLTE